MIPYEPIKYWCFKVLPLVYDESLSYYEQLCKMRLKLNEMITEMNELSDVVKDIQNAIKQIDEWIENFDTSVIEQWLKENLAQMIFVDITDTGYFRVTIPESWSDITFRTSGWDYYLEPSTEYGNLLLLY